MATQGWLVGPGEKARRKFSSTSGKAPGYRLSPDHFQTFKLCIIVPNRRTATPESFFVSSYTTAIDSIAARLALATKKCTQSGNFQFDINSPFQNTLYPKTKDAFAKYKLDLTIGIHACIDHAFVNIREFKMPRQPTATKTSHEKWSHIFSVSGLSWLFQLAYFVKCKRTLLELNFYQPYPS